LLARRRRLRYGVRALYPILFKLGPFTVYSFGVMMALGFYAAALLRDPMGQMLSGAGFVWYGGLIGGFLAAFVLTRRYHIRFVTMVECAAPGLAIGQALGRIGCHVSGDGDWGIPTEHPWGYAYTNAIVGWDYAPGVLVHPTPLYEAAAYTALFCLLWALRKRNPPDGTLFAVYLVGSSAARFAVEFIRINPRIALGLSQAQWIAIVLFLCGAALLLRNVVGGARVREAAS
jgi:phosphatidylglycerol:prolipoprotein diacylglycerol transferase